MNAALIVRDIELPDWFEVMVRQRDLFIADGKTRATAQGVWLKARDELHRRGYRVWEYWDEERKSYVASCQRQS